MDFLDPNKQRRNTIQLFIGYVLVAIAILLATTLLIMYAYGFRLNREGQLDQLGLVFVSSQPSGSDVFVDGELEEATNAKLNLVAGQYDLRITRDGYTDWRRGITVNGGSVDHYVYPLLIPTELSQNTLATYETRPVLASQSPDKRWLLVQAAASDAFQVYDLNRSQETIAEATEYTIPAAVLTESAEPARWSVVEWSDNNRHILLSREYTSQSSDELEYILFDRGRVENSRNLSRDLALEPGQVVSLRDKNPDTYYIHDTNAQTLNAVSLNDAEQESILEDVLAYKTHGRDMILYATPDDTDETMSQIVLWEDNQTYPIRTVNASDVYLLDVARYDSDWYVVAGSQAEDRVYLYRNPVVTLRDSRTGFPTSNFAFRITRPTAVTFSGNAQFVAVQNATDIHVYDAENISAYSYDIPFPLDKPQARVKWMDGHRFSYVSEGRQVLFEYDNSNSRKLTAALPAYGSFYDRDARFMYSFVRSPAGGPGVNLAVTPLRTEADL